MLMLSLVPALVFGSLLACTAAWLVAHKYKQQMRQLRRSPIPGDSPPQVVYAPATPPPPAPLSLADHRKAGIRLMLLLIGLSCLIATTSAYIWMALVYGDEPWPRERLWVMPLLYLWPVVLALAVMWRWSRVRTLLAMLVWGGFCFSIFIHWPFFRWHDDESKLLQLLMQMASEVGYSFVLVTLVFMGTVTRAVAPWLLAPLTVVVWMSIFSVTVFASMLSQHTAWVTQFAQWAGGYTAAALFALLPLILAWWPMRSLGRALGRAYARKQMSDLMVLFTGVWAFALIDHVWMVGSGSAGAAAFAILLPLLWIPLVMKLYDKWRPINARPPTLLVLRVFERDAQAQSLFDHIIERWRLSGNTVLIAWTDLADRTLDADDIFQFLDGRLSNRFIRHPADVAQALGALDLKTDIDGRYRVNELYCHDATWKEVLHALIGCSDVVLMDLRGFRANNAGCSYELSALAQAPRQFRVVVLRDGETNFAEAQRAIATNRQERFVWIDTSHFATRHRREVLERLFEYLTASTRGPSARSL